MSNKIKLISKLNFDIQDTNIDKLAKNILNTSSFEFDEYKDKPLKNYIVIINKDKSLWNDEYFRDHVSLLDNNFSKERLIHILEIRDYLYIKNTNSKKKIYIVIFLVLLLSIIYMLSTKTEFLKDQNATNISKNQG